MLEDLTSGTDQERQEFMAVCVETLNRFRKSDMITPIFVFERLCNIIHPVSVATHIALTVFVNVCIARIC